MADGKSQMANKSVHQLAASSARLSFGVLVFGHNNVPFSSNLVEAFRYFREDFYGMALFVDLPSAICPLPFAVPGAVKTCRSSSERLVLSSLHFARSGHHFTDQMVERQEPDPDCASIVLPARRTPRSQRTERWRQLSSTRSIQ